MALVTFTSGCSCPPPRGGRGRPCPRGEPRTGRARSEFGTRRFARRRGRARFRAGREPRARTRSLGARRRVRPPRRAALAGESPGAVDEDADADAFALGVAQVVDLAVLRDDVLAPQRYRTGVRIGRTGSCRRVDRRVGQRLHARSLAPPFGRSTLYSCAGPFARNRRDGRFATRSSEIRDAYEPGSDPSRDGGSARADRTLALARWWRNW